MSASGWLSLSRISTGLSNVPPAGSIAGGASTGRPGHAVDPRPHQRDAALIDGLAVDRRHADVAHRVDPHVGDRSPDIVRRDDARTIDALIEQHRAVHQFLPLERRVVACVESRHRAAGPMALGAIRIEVGSRAIVQAARLVVRPPRAALSSMSVSSRGASRTAQGDSTRAARCP
jgi:hypothetical protein